ncbi:hypothetical protein RDI58_024862 [Solanum bulbocastanum]|uniref:Uncharacterized protein n=1 Tax=Solanum bulbocastanum TaxID=147425 RepID=A0AAN8T207_SOLBU
MQVYTYINFSFFFKKQPEISSQRILPTGSSYKDASLTGIDLGFKPRGLRWKNKDVVTTSQLQQMANKKK